MNLFTFPASPETRGDDFPCSEFRWALQVTPTYFGLVHQRRWRATGEWCDSHTAAYLIGVRRNFRLARDHVYYDGSHCILNLGFIWIQYNGVRWCDKCHGDS